MENNCEVKPGPTSAKEFFKSGNFWKPFLGVTLGGLAGFLYYYFVGCSSGSCAITSSPYMSTIYGGLMGLFVVKSPCSRGKC
ncbi:MAG: DUF6132 family protein [Mariniphaga sp.]